MLILLTSLNVTSGKKGVNSGVIPQQAPDQTANYVH